MIRFPVPHLFGAALLALVATPLAAQPAPAAPPKLPELDAEGLAKCNGEKAEAVARR